MVSVVATLLALQALASGPVPIASAEPVAVVSNESDTGTRTEAQASPSPTPSLTAAPSPSPAAAPTPASAAAPPVLPLEPPTPESIIAVPPGLLGRLHEQVIRRATTRELRLQRLADFMFDPEGLALQYDADTTRTVEESYRDRKANCLSFSLLFVALAREAGLDASIQETDQVLSWYEEGGTVYNTGHVNVGVRIGRARHTVDIDRSVLLTRSPPLAISTERVLAHFYNNRGAELLARGQPVAARRHLETAIAMDPDFLGAWNNLGVLNLREGDAQAAERAYTVALSRNPRHSATLLNLAALYKRTGDLARSAALERRLQKVQLKDPFHQLLLAIGYEKRGDYANAVVHYKRAIRLHRDEHRFHFGLARVYMRLGDLRRARRALAQAHELANDDDNRSLYQAKLHRLQQLHGR